MVKFDAGGVNVVSGELAEKSLATKLRRAKLKSQGESIQDYVVTDKQPWLAGLDHTSSD